MSNALEFIKALKELKRVCSISSYEGLKEIVVSDKLFNELVAELRHMYTHAAVPKSIITEIVLYGVTIKFLREKGE